MATTVTFTIEVTNLVIPSTNVIYENVKAVAGETLYQAMCTLEKTPGCGFTFKSDESTYGHFITSINCLNQDPTKDDYWTIRIGKLDIWAPKGVDELYPKQGEKYIFAYTNTSDDHANKKK